jgi:hypothetical protein
LNDCSGPLAKCTWCNWVASQAASLLLEDVNICAATASVPAVNIGAIINVTMAAVLCHDMPSTPTRDQ